MADEEIELVRAARRGDPDAWDVLFKRHQLPLYVFIVKMVRNETTALDIVQETFIAATRHIASLRDEKRFVSWLFSIARQKCTQHWRRSKREPEPLLEREDFEPVDDIQPGDWLLADDQAEQAHALLNQLPEAHREVMVLFFLDEFSLEEISESTNSKIGTVNSRLHYAKKTLRELVEKKNENTERYPVGKTC